MTKEAILLVSREVFQCTGFPEEDYDEFDLGGSQRACGEYDSFIDWYMFGHIVPLHNLLAHDHDYPYLLPPFDEPLLDTLKESFIACLSMLRDETLLTWAGHYPVCWGRWAIREIQKRGLLINSNQ